MFGRIGLPYVILSQKKPCNRVIRFFSCRYLLRDKNKKGCTVWLLPAGTTFFC